MGGTNPFINSQIDGKKVQKLPKKGSGQGAESPGKPYSLFCPGHGGGWVGRKGKKIQKKTKVGALKREVALWCLWGGESRKKKKKK